MTHSRSLPVFGVVAVTTIWAVSALANGMAGMELAADPQLRAILGAASIACDVLKAICLFLLMGAFVQRRWVAVGVTALVFLLATGWSLRSAVYFASWGIADRANTLTHQEMLTETHLSLIATKKRRAEFLAEQRVDVKSKYRSIREAAAEANAQSAEEFSAIISEIEKDLEKLRAAEPTPVIDPMARTFNLPQHTVALWTAIAFALLLEISSSTGFWIVSRGRLPAPTKPPKPAETLPAVVSVSPPAPLPVATPEPVRQVQTSENLEVVVSDPEMVVVDADTERLVKALVAVIEPGREDDRMQLGEVAYAINRLLPPRKRLTNKTTMSVQLGAALPVAFPASDKRRSGGQTWIYGIRKREASAQARMA